MKERMSWNLRFALMNHFKLSDERACEVLKVTSDELKTAKYLRDNNGYFKPDTNVDFGQYEHLVNPPTTPKAKNDTTQKAKNDTTQKPKNDTTQNPKSATSGRKRGRPGDKIKKAYAAITTDKVPVEDFMSEHHVSLSVLRRHRDFDHLKETGQVNVKKVKLNESDKEKVLCIWRNPAL